MKRITPPESTTAKPFWDATRDQRLALQWCNACDKAIFYPREVCPRCAGTSLEWRDASGRGQVYAVTVPRLSGGRSGDSSDDPYCVAIIELDEGVRMMSNVIGIAPDDVTVGQPVEVTWEPLEDGRNLPQFQPVGD